MDVEDDQAKITLARLSVLTDRLEDTTQQLADLVAVLRKEEQGASSDT